MPSSDRRRPSRARTAVMGGGSNNNNNNEPRKTRSNDTAASSDTPRRSRRLDVESTPSPSPKRAKNNNAGESSANKKTPSSTDKNDDDNHKAGRVQPLRRSTSRSRSITTTEQQQQTPPQETPQRVSSNKSTGSSTKKTPASAPRRELPARAGSVRAIAKSSSNDSNRNNNRQNNILKSTSSSSSRRTSPRQRIRAPGSLADLSASEVEDDEDEEEHEDDEEEEVVEEPKTEKQRAENKVDADSEQGKNNKEEQDEKSPNKDAESAKPSNKSTSKKSEPVARPDVVARTPSSMSNAAAASHGPRRRSTLQAPARRQPIRSSVTISTPIINKPPKDSDSDDDDDDDNEEESTTNNSANDDGGAEEPDATGNTDKEAMETDSEGQSKDAGNEDEDEGSKDDNMSIEENEEDDNGNADDDNEDGAKAGRGRRTLRHSTRNRRPVAKLREGSTSSDEDDANNDPRTPIMANYSKSMSRAGGRRKVLTDTGRRPRRAAAAAAAASNNNRISANDRSPAARSNNRIQRNGSQGVNGKKKRGRPPKIRPIIESEGDTDESRDFYSDDDSITTHDEASLFESDEEEAWFTSSRSHKHQRAAELALLNHAHQLSYPWDKLHLGTHLGTAALNEYIVRRQLRAETVRTGYSRGRSVPQYTAQQVLPMIQSLKVATVFPPPKSELHAVAQKKRDLLKDKGDGEKYMEVTVDMECDDDKHDDQTAEGEKGEKKTKSQYFFGPKIPCASLANLYENMLEQDIDDGRETRRQAQFMSPDACIDRLRGMEEKITSLKVREQRIMRTAEDVGLISPDNPAGNIAVNRLLGCIPRGINDVGEEDYM